ncbi:MAG TPA: hypothetical protein VE197_07670 [Mycobacterium sp.]|nr:hypothetical protein [Mycobacterium sp.]
MLTDNPPSGLGLPQAAAISHTAAANIAVALRASRRGIVIAADIIATSYVTTHSLGVRQVSVWFCFFLCGKGQR